MIRVEIIANIELIDELQKHLVEEFSECYYTMTPVLKGYGKRGYAFGDSVWPETNFMCLFYLTKNETQDLTTRLPELKNLCDKIQNSAPQNAIKIFATEVQEV